MPPEPLADAVRLHRAGRLAEAEPIYRRILARNPRHVDALHLLGLVAAQSGRPSEALELFGRALALSPDFGLAHFNRGNALRALGRREEALAAFEAAARLDPRHAPSHDGAGAMLRELGRPREAAAAHLKALGQRPDDYATLVDLGAALRAAGSLGDALGAYERAAAVRPDSPEGHAGVGTVLEELGRPAEALASLRRALDLAPGEPDAHLRLGVALQALGQHDAALGAYREALSLRPEFAEAQVSLAVALQEMGQGAEALAAVDRALAIEPAQARAWFVRADLKTFALDDPDLAAMADVLASADARRLSPDDRLDLEFALGKAWMDVGDADRAFAALTAGNRRMRAAYAYDVASDIRRFEAIARAFTPALIARHAGAGDPSDLPVFVVGMPRSGTTLVEQILAAHPAARGAGELPALARAIDAAFPSGYLPALAGRPPGAFAPVGRAYLQAVAGLADGAERLVDKMPGNFEFAGPIHLALTNARIVHCRRDPLDTCLSCYSKKFAGRQEFAYDLAELGRYWRAYDALMTHWRAVLPADRFLEVDYEAVVGDLEGQARRLVAFCGLAWDDACLAFHAGRRQVRTASANQVRRPIYRSSIARWKPYAAHLGPLLEALGMNAAGG